MTHLYIKLCDLCGKPCEAGSQMHGGNITTNIFISKNKVSTSVFREEFDICVDCLNKTGLFKILKGMAEQKDKNKRTEESTKKLIEQSQKQLR